MSSFRHTTQKPSSRHRALRFLSVGGRFWVLAVPALVVSIVSIASAASLLSAAHRGHHHRHHKRRAVAQFKISGFLARPITLGTSGAEPLQLTITNARRKRLIVTHLQVSVSAVHQHAGAKGSCAQTGAHSPNFAVTNLPASYRLVIPPHSTMSVAKLGKGLQPIVTWLNQPWAQNGCLGAQMSFSYLARGRYVKPHHRRHKHRRRHR